jgi:uncharacterized membrane protein YphA (DoxX/SURF4 family)
MNNSPSRVRTIVSYVGFMLNLLVAAFVIMAGSGKLTPPSDDIKKMMSEHLLANLKLLGIGEIAVGILLIIPWTSSIGAMLMCGFWGGTIAYHMSLGQDYTMQAVFLLITIIGTFMRWPQMLASVWWKWGQSPG